MLTAGLDIGSRTIALVVWDGERVTRADVVDTGANPLVNSRRLLAGTAYDRLVATGYGRHLATEQALANEVITEIKAYAIGARHLYPDVRTVLDIGGQDSKVILVRPEGGAARFEMNDRCAAGTGRFLENMARALGLSLEQFYQHALEAQGPAVRLSSTCTVFAESEVVSLIGRGEDSRRVALGIHRAITGRVSAMVRRVGVHERFVFAGGGGPESLHAPALGRGAGHALDDTGQPADRWRTRSCPARGSRTAGHLNLGSVDGPASSPATWRRASRGIGTPQP